LTSLRNDGGASGANVKAGKRCTARQPRPRIAGKLFPNRYFYGQLAMLLAKLFLYFYVAQAALGAAIGFALPFIHMIAD
jgi:hypothetical protein